MLDVIPVGTLISCFNSRVKQNSIYFLTSELILYVIPFRCVYIFSNKFTPFCKISIFMSTSMNISFSNMIKVFRISANNCKKFVSLNYKLYLRYGFGFWKEQIHKDNFDFFRRNISSVEIDFIFYITCNTSTFSVSVILNYAVAFHIDFCVSNCSI